MWGWKKYVPVHVRKERAQKEMNKKKKKGEAIEPIEIQGKKIVTEFWGIRWCEHLEKFSDFKNRLPRGRTYVRNGSVCHLAIKEGAIEAMVSGSELYTIKVSIKTLAKQKWDSIKRKCSGHIGTMLELLQGRLSTQVMQVVADEKEGLFPEPKEMSFSCSCPDWADMCKHVAAVLYGIGHRLDSRPELLFLLRGVSAQDLISTELALAAPTASNQIEEQGLAELFGIDLEQEAAIPIQPPTPKKAKKQKQANSRSGLHLDIERLKGSDLIAFRKHKKLSVIQLAKALQVTPASIYRWEKSTETLNLQMKSQEALKALLSQG